MSRNFGSLGVDRRKKIWEAAKQKGLLKRCIDCGTYYRTNLNIDEGCPSCQSHRTFIAGTIRYKHWKEWRV